MELPESFEFILTEDMVTDLDVKGLGYDFIDLVTKSPDSVNSEHELAHFLGPHDPEIYVNGKIQTTTAFLQFFRQGLFKKLKDAEFAINVSGKVKEGEGYKLVWKSAAQRSHDQKIRWDEAEAYIWRRKDGSCWLHSVKFIMSKAAPYVAIDHHHHHH
uniref:Secreted protein n=1 Tax=Melampsora laricis-populina TaxID=203908 RepID=UPI0012F47749|nr:Chain A, Secreted protein [Melampsora laricis-populina]